MHHISWACSIGAVIGVFAVAVLVPVYGMAGAVCASYIGEAMMSVVLIFAALRAAR